MSNIFAVNQLECFSSDSVTHILHLSFLMVFLMPLCSPVLVDSKCFSVALANSLLEIQKHSQDDFEIEVCLRRNHVVYLCNVKKIMQCFSFAHFSLSMLSLYRKWKDWRVVDIF